MLWVHFSLFGPKFSLAPQNFDAGAATANKVCTIYTAPAGKHMRNLSMLNIQQACTHKTVVWELNIYCRGENKWAIVA